MMVRASCRLLAVVSAALLWTALLVVGSTPGAHAADEPGRLRIGHLSPDSPAVDVALTPAPPAGPAANPGIDVASGLGYGDVSRYRELAAGTYAVSVRPAGTPSTTPPALSARVEVPSGGVRTLALSGSFADLALTSLTDELTAPADGTARVRVLAAAAGAPAVDVAVDGGPVLATGLPFSTADGYSAVAAGPATVRLGTGHDVTTAALDFIPGTVVSLLVLDAPNGGLTVRAVLDAAAPAVVPIGAVEAGGSAGRPGALPAVLGGPALLAARTPLVAVALATRAAQPPATAALSGEPAPVRLRVPAIGVDAPLTGAGLDAVGALAVPASPTVAGWYASGPVPGRPGSAVLAGHVDWAGRPGVFEELHRLSLGDEILVDGADGTSVRFSVSRVLQVPKNAFPTDAVYGPVPGAELRLITCGGTFDRKAGSYRDNVVVFARLA